MAENSLNHILNKQVSAWKHKPTLRYIYQRWFEALRQRMATVPGHNLEVGTGIGSLRHAIPGLTGLDIEPTPWTDMVGDAQCLPIRDKSLSNIVCFDVLHHIPRPLLFLQEAKRTLTIGGRLLIMDPYISPLSWVAYNWFHPEDMSMNCDPLNPNSDICSNKPFDSNQAVATRIFFTDIERFKKVLPGISILERSRIALMAYPATGGFGGRTLLPDAVIRFIDHTEKYLDFLAPLMAFRTLVVIERLK